MVNYQQGEPFRTSRVMFFTNVFILYSLEVSFFSTIIFYIRSDLKHEQKATRKAKKRAEKASVAAQNALASIDAIDIAEKLNDEEISPNEYFKLRSAVVAELKSSPKTHPYPHKFHVSMSLEAFIEKYSSLEDGEQLDAVKLTLAGRVHSIRESGAKLIFYDLHGEGVKLQVMANAKAYETMNGFFEVTKTIRRGDIIGITGSPLRTRMGELSILATKVS